ncbi:MAG: 3-phosphoshikimate 1-carboxyvinyltransferase [Bacteroidetes bacterium HGW-Bacteroidetes-15]|nr:MAG: 3-phosphoshikimate 1-carboxyvinyltransferase [Bacteroidetes bacterium HGW-Bacteroidetes-15]
MLIYTISKGDRNLSGEISLAPSKSISNRDIVIRALRNSKFDIKAISEKDAAKVIDKLLRKGKVTLDKGDPAKAIRFLRAFLTYFKGEWIITGSAEMRKRPVGDVIDILHNQGLNIKYLERDGFPALKIIGKGLKGSITRVDASICSQFISASLLISQVLPAEDVVGLKNRIINSPYIDQTIRLLNYLGVNSNWDKQEILVEHQLNDGTEMSIEPDWLSASYWYQMAALASKAEFKINGLNPESVQSDAIVKEIFEPLGVKTIITEKGVIITKAKRKIKTFEYNFSNNPDLVPTLVVTCVALKIPFRFSGIEILRHKDTDRVMALQTQMIKLGAKIKVEKKGELETLTFDGKSKISVKEPITFSTFGDHRIAMALAPLSILGLKLNLEDPRAVSKSYPCYWDDYKKLGFQIVQI